MKKFMCLNNETFTLSEIGKEVKSVEAFPFDLHKTNCGLLSKKGVERYRNDDPTLFAKDVEPDLLETLAGIYYDEKTNTLYFETHNDYEVKDLIGCGIVEG